MKSWLLWSAGLCSRNRASNVRPHGYTVHLHVIVLGERGRDLGRSGRLKSHTTRHTALWCLKKKSYMLATRPEHSRWPWRITR